MDQQSRQTPMAIGLVLAGLIVGVLTGRSCSTVDTTADVESPGALVQQEPEVGVTADVPDAARPAPVQPPVADPAAKWLNKRPASPAVAYLFGKDRSSLAPIGGTLVKEPYNRKAMALEASGHVYLTDRGAVFLDGGRLLSVSAGRALSQAIRKSGKLSVEALLFPGDTRHDGPARIVSISRDGSVRNLTLGQEGSRWIVRLRTTSAGENGTSPEHRSRGLTVAYTHVVATYDRKTVKVYVNGEKVYKSNDGSGPITNWVDDFPLVIGNEAYEARDWAGVVRFVAFYDRHLNDNQVRKLSAALPDGDPILGTRLPSAPTTTSQPAATEGVGEEREVF
jgi:hypothetical protein